MNYSDENYLTNPELRVVIETVTGVNYDDNPSYYMQLSPLHRATSSAPPTILCYGNQDPLIPTTQGTAMRDKLVELGVAHQFTLYPNAGHGWIGLDLLDTTIKLHAFIEAHL